MYLSILILPVLGSLISGLLGRKIGSTGAQFVTISCLTLASILSSIAFYEVGLMGSPVYIDLGSWMDSDFFSIGWEFAFDQITVIMLIPVLYISTLIHIYSISYMNEDPHIPRFFSYLSGFTAGMLTILCSGNYFVLFVGWEAIGIFSYLLISYYFTRIQAVKSGLLALVMNRVGDMGVSIGFFGMFALFGSVNYSTLFNVTPFVNETSITVISLLIFTGTIAKSAQLPLVTWLSNSMEGLNHNKHVLIIIIIHISYLIINESCSNIEIYHSILPLSASKLSKEILHTITGNMLGDGSILYNRISEDGKPKGNARYSMTMNSRSLNYLTDLYDNVYSRFSLSGLHPYPNIDLPKHSGETVKQYSFSTRSIPLFTELHDIWYVWDNDVKKFIKIVPSNIAEMFSIVSLAHWIMNDGYFDNYGRTNTLILCTESFTKEGCISLQSLLKDLDIKSTLKRRNKDKDLYRIRISKTSIPLLKSLVKPYIHKDFVYKLGN